MFLLKAYFSPAMKLKTINDAIRCRILKCSFLMIQTAFIKMQINHKLPHVIPFVIKFTEIFIEPSN